MKLILSLFLLLTIIFCSAEGNKLSAQRIDFTSSDVADAAERLTGHRASMTNEIHLLAGTRLAGPAITLHVVRDERASLTVESADYWSQVSVPVLVIYGERDLYVPVAQSISNIDRALSKAKNRDYTILVLPRASHAFIIERETGQPFEWWHIAPGFPDLLTAWINHRIK